VVSRIRVIIYAHSLFVARSPPPWQVERYTAISRTYRSSILKTTDTLYLE